MNREFEILNEKLNNIYNEILYLRQDFEKSKYEQEKKTLEYKLENAQEELERHKENIRFIFENIEEKGKYFRSIQERFPKEEVSCERL